MLTKVTITGADDATDVGALIDLTAEFPFVEWGILVSLRAEGGSRFPSRTWIDRFVTKAVDESLNTSMHICGQWVRDLLRGRLDWNVLPEVRLVADRVQINTHAQEHISTCAALDWIQEHAAKQFIFQLDNVNNHVFDAAAYQRLNVAGLFDCSHGAGTLPDQWPMVCDNRKYGYAGGLGPANVVEQVNTLNRLRLGPGLLQTPYWIDMEGRVRDEEEHLDLAKVRKVLESCTPLVNQK